LQTPLPVLLPVAVAVASPFSDCGHVKPLFGCQEAFGPA
jgi:hypothetical protein